MMRIRMRDGTSMRAEDYFENAVDQWIEQTSQDGRTFRSFCSFMRLAGFNWGREWMSDRWEEIHCPDCGTIHACPACDAA